MKFITLVLLIHLTYAYSNAQVAAIEQHGYNREFDIGLKNYLTITAENCPCKSLIVTTSRGKITGDSCQYVYKSDTATNFKKGKYRHPEGTENYTELKIYKKVGRDSVFLRNIFYQLVFIPDPIAIFGAHRNGDTVTQVREFFSSNFMVLGSWVENFHAPVTFSVQSYKVSITRGDSTILSNYINIGNWFTKDLIKEFEKLNYGDKVTFYDIYTKGNDGTYRLIKPLTLVLYDRFKRGRS